MNSPSLETDSVPSTPSFELDTPDQTFSSDIEASAQLTDPCNLKSTLEDVSSVMLVSSDIDEEKGLTQNGATPRLPFVPPP
jgi:hypothetical protein